MPKLKINDIEIEVAPGTSILQAAEQLGIEIPRFCYHDRLSVPGNCRMCLVEVKGGPPKPQASCALACADNMEVFTDSEMVHKARKGVMEFLLINHPLDCPICDQGGECDLQDQAVAYGFDRSRYFESKRAVKDKDFGPLIETNMTRCIQCTRCVRFATEIAGVDDLGLLNRGEDVEIGTYVGKAIESELSGNLADVCPVGALLNKPNSFRARAWELARTDSIDVLDAVGSNIRVDTRGNEVMRILPRLNEAVNEEWLGDKSRYACDGLKYQRLDRPYIREQGKMRAATWDEAFLKAAEAIKAVSGGQIAALAGDLADVEAVYALRDLMRGMGAGMMDCRVDGARIDVAGAAAGWRFNTTIAGLEQADAIVLVGTDPRKEAPIVNARIRKVWMTKRIPVYVIGQALDLNYPYTHLGTGAEALAALDIKAEKPALILGMGALMGEDAGAVLALARAKAKIADGWNGFNLLHTAAGRMGALSIGFVPPGGQFSKKGIKLWYLMGVDNPDVFSHMIGKDDFVIYQGHHGDAGAARADVILPGAAYTEKTALYMNTEGRVQTTRAAVTPPGMAKEDWKIVRAFSEVLGQTLVYNTHAELRARIAGEFPAFAAVGEITPVAWGDFGAAGAAKTAIFASPVGNYYQTDPVSRASPTMAQCVAAFTAQTKARAA
ncbi:MAG: NADH-quinone oxidoreductase subunit G [Rhodospirillales bacterium]|nr:NADH-quinone oxidoreductase subunit G [Alphaproteobacteria bacterium]MCB9987339.1 NADH-quinone oxidoreductase subunit G [Rhodospirillales bacterium]USO07809.1 MAG: NADH-quinone oxidoreductase subunit G [Rhodospirillales bacterium]